MTTGVRVGQRERLGLNFKAGAPSPRRVTAGSCASQGFGGFCCRVNQDETPQEEAGAPPRAIHCSGFVPGQMRRA